MQSSPLLCFVCVASLMAVANAGLLIAEHPVGLEVNSTEVTVFLECRATSGGEIAHWLHNGVQIDPDTDSGVSVNTTTGAGGTSTLIISSYEESDAGNYRCAARSVSSPSVIEVSHQAPVSHFTQREFITQPQDFTVYVIFNTGQSAASREAAAFNCQFATLPRYGRRPVIVWEYESTASGSTEVLEQSGSTMLSTFQFEHTGYFQLHSPTDADDGSRVRCIARHPDDEAQQVMSEWATITISNSSRPANFSVFTTRMPSELYKVEGQQLVLGCSQSTAVTSVPLQWVDSSGLPFFTAGLSFIVLRPDLSPYGWSNVLIPDTVSDFVVGETFTCRVTVDPDVLTWDTTLVAPPPPLPPLTYNDQQVSHTLDYGVPGIRLFADVSSTNYSGGFQWWFNGLPIADSALNYQLSDDMLTLTILGITFENIGLYQVDLVDVDPEAQFLNFYIDVRGGEAFVLPGDTEVLAESGSSVTLPCSTNGNVPMVTDHLWTHNGDPISTGGGYSLSSDGSLTISSVAVANAGTYSCSPVNTLGTFNSTSIRLDVSASVNITWMDGDYQLVGGVSALTCITPFPAGLEITSDGVLRVSNVQPTFNGQYQCQLRPSHDGDVIITVNVIGGGEAFVLPGDTEVSVESGSSVTLPCSTDGNVPMVTDHLWTHNGDPISTGGGYSLSSDGSLTISSVAVANAGTYSCSPVNALGTFNSTSIRLDVSVGITVNWTITIDCPLVDGASAVSCDMPFPHGVTITPTGVLKLQRAEVGSSGVYRCQLSPSYPGYFIVNLLVQGYSPEVPEITSVELVDNNKSLLIDWSDVNDPLRPVERYTLEVRTSPLDGKDADSDKTDKRNGTKTFIISGATTKHVIPNVDLKQNYTFRVEAVNDVGRSGFSDEVSFSKPMKVFIGGESGESEQQSGGLRPWVIALIVIFILLLLLLCCILFLCIFLCWRRERRSYYAAKREQKDKKDFESYRQTDEPDDKL